MHTQQFLLADVIGAIGTEDFQNVTAGSICRFTGFELSAVLVHKEKLPASLLFTNFVNDDHRRGIDNYISHTWAINPILKIAANAPGFGVFRGRDFRISNIEATGEIEDHLSWSSQEDLGFRTKGWPANLEEVIIYFHACGGLVELGIYRERARQPLSSQKLRELAELGQPIAAAFDKNAALMRRSILPRRVADHRLTPREAQIVDLLLIGCSSEAIELRLGLSRHTIKDYRKLAYRKLGISSLAELFAAYAQLQGSPPRGG